MGKIVLLRFERSQEIGVKRGRVFQVWRTASKKAESGDGVLYASNSEKDSVVGLVVSYLQRSKV